MITSALIGAITASFLLTSWAMYRARTRKRPAPAVAIEYRDATSSGVWCTFETALAAIEAAAALNDAYAGAKTFWVGDSAIRQAPDYIGVVTLPEPAPKPKARPKPGTPIVRQDTAGIWSVSVKNFKIEYGSGEAGYRAALDAVERAHHE